MGNKKFLFIFVLILFFSLACNLTKMINTNTPGSQNTEDQNILPSDDQPSDQEMPEQSLSPSGEPVSQPVGIRKGVSTLDSYKLTVEIETIGPSPNEISRIQVQQENASSQDTTFFFVTNFSQTLEDPEPSTSTTNNYQIGNETCSGSDQDGYSYSITEPDQKELQDVLKDLFDFNFLIENPQFIGQEELNGVQTNHFVFQLSGLGVTSGAQVLANQGEYWLAVDGNYIVRYTLLVETSTSPEEINHLKVWVNLEDINQPKSLSMPQGCIDAKNSPE
ncbi:MAG: hypothetical protein CL609_00775 [Anaerolineaceae bacterium]|nr:hypothetical protein [Anaerolineaceae bacterium]